MHFSWPVYGEVLVSVKRAPPPPPPLPRHLPESIVQVQILRGQFNYLQVAAASRLVA